MSKRRAGRPPQNIIVPHPLRGDKWLQIGKYDKHWPAANRYWCLVRKGASRASALTSAATELEVEEQRLVDWLRRARKRGPIAHSDDGWHPDK